MGTIRKQYIAILNPDGISALSLYPRTIACFIAQSLGDYSFGSVGMKRANK